ncbi:MAG: hypothetical protein F6K11_07585 [Leptolyngbya sp. SIO3F4]|nr:hypothetical protein [Leptolyngbya sp. SIO3F4]
MANNSKHNELEQIFIGFGLLLGCHFAAGMLIYIVSLIIGPLLGFHYFAGVIATGSIIGFMFVQLLYAIPMIIRFRQRRKFGMMKGVIIGAFLTALVNGGCFIAFTQLFKL